MSYEEEEKNGNKSSSEEENSLMCCINSDIIQEAPRGERKKEQHSIMNRRKKTISDMLYIFAFFHFSKRLVENTKACEIKSLNLLRKEKRESKKVHVNIREKKQMMNTFPPPSIITEL